MRIFTDLHLHSRFSRGCSKNINLELLEKAARRKGIGLLGTGDFTHPIWRQEIGKMAEKDGLLWSETGFPFMLTTELSLIYFQGGKTRKVHLVIMAPGLTQVDIFTDSLKRLGRVDYDGRPIFKLPCPDLVKMLRNIDEGFEVIPAHIWTPWFSLFGSRSGFDTVEECFGDQTEYIHALETGLSSDPQMNWRISSLDRFSFVSFSDAHSTSMWRLGREATAFDLDSVTYDNILDKIRSGDIALTIEVEPAYGKYHLDGHRSCGIKINPNIERKKICPSCKKPLTLGVLNRVLELADRPDGFFRKDAPPTIKSLPLHELISFSTGNGLATKTVAEIFDHLIDAFGSEYAVLFDTPLKEIEKEAGRQIAGVVEKNRGQMLMVSPGFDGVYGFIKTDTTNVGLLPYLSDV